MRQCLIAMPREHSEFGASPSERWGKCTASILACRGKQDTPSKYAEEGTAAHLVAEVCLCDNEDAEVYLGRKVEVRQDADKQGNIYICDEEMVEGVQLFLDTVRADAAALPQARIFSERVFHLPKVHQTAFGSTDACVLQPMGLGIVYDFKYGRKPVEVEENTQMKFYGIGALSAPEFFSAEEIELVIVQPRTPGNQVRRWRTTPEALQAFEGHLKAKVDEALAGGKFVVGDHCTYCRNAVDCAAKRGTMLDPMVCPFDPIKDATALIPAPVPPSYLTTAQLERWIELAELLEPHFEAVRGALRGKLERGDSDAPTRFKLVDGKKTRKWASDEAVLDLCIPPDICYERTIRSPAQMEKALKSAKLDPRIIEPAVVTSRGVVMAPITDPRPAILHAAPFQPIPLIPE